MRKVKKPVSPAKLWTVTAILIFVAFCFIGAFNDAATEMRQENAVPGNRLHESQAVVLCRDAYRNFAKFQADIGMFDPYTVFETEDGWVVKLEGRIQNAFGAWLKVDAHCAVPYSPPYDIFDLRNISEFEFIQ